MRKLVAKGSVVTLALAALTSLVIHASCSRGAPPAGPEPQAAQQAPASTTSAPTKAAPAATAESEPDEEPSNVYMGASKAGPMIRPQRSKKPPPQQAPSPANGNGTQGKP